MTNERPEGRRFTEMYREPGERVDDSARFRRRFGFFLYEALTLDVAKEIRVRTGISLSRSQPSWVLKAVEELSLDELLDLTTVLVEVFDSLDESDKAEAVIRFVALAFTEENMVYEMDKKGGVHYRVDQAFQEKRMSAVEVLSKAGMTASRDAFEKAHRSLNAHPADTLTAVRSAFEAVENLFKVKFTTSRLGDAELKKKLSSKGERDGDRANDTARLFNAGFATWVNACHQYRHADGVPEPTPPPRWLATALVDSAATYIRYLTS